MVYNARSWSVYFEMISPVYVLERNQLIFVRPHRTLVALQFSDIKPFVAICGISSYARSDAHFLKKNWPYFILAVQEHGVGSLCLVCVTPGITFIQTVPVCEEDYVDRCPRRLGGRGCYVCLHAVRGRWQDETSWYPYFPARRTKVWQS